MKLLLLLLPIFLYANLTFVSNYKKELGVLESFDIQPSFLYDPIMNEIRSKSSISKNKHFFRAMNEAYTFIPIIKNILTQNRIPQEFLYLAMAESNFSTKAFSTKRASGLWQFMPDTAKHYNLRIDDYVDERRDLIKSTKAAAKYLKRLHKRFGKWYLAAIAYNCGSGKLRRAINKAGTDDLSALIDEKKMYIPKESRNYIRKIVALSLVGADEQFLLKSEHEHLLNRSNAYSISTVQLPSGESLKRVSNLVDIPLSDLQILNRHLKYDFIPPDEEKYDVYIPYVKLSDFKQKYFEQATKNIYKIHVVKSGESLSVIGKRYGVPYRIIKDFNHLKTTRLKLKQKLIIPIDSKASKLVVNNEFYHKVKKGDSLESISKTYKVSIQDLKVNNKIKGSLIKIGDRLKIHD